MPDVTVRVYGPLNDFLPPKRRQAPWCQRLDGPVSVKDLIESAGVPHPEIDLVLVNGEPVAFDYAVKPADRVAVFPRFTTLDVDAVTRVRPAPLDAIRFVADVHLGTLARRLRLAGLDTAYGQQLEDAALAAMSAREGRILLTRDQVLLKRRAIAHGYFVRATDPHAQFVEVLRRFAPLDLRPFSRCLRCNDRLARVTKAEVEPALPPRTREHFDEFHRCGGCGRVYWKGSQWARLAEAVAAACAEAQAPSLPARSA